MLDLHDFGGTGATRCFRALGAALLDIPNSPTADAMFVTTSATVPSREGESRAPSHAFRRRPYLGCFCRS